jgi:predicted PurR-regulated permease PerM
MSMFSLPKDSHTVHISPSIVVFTVSFLLGLFFLYSIRSILMLVFLAFLLMVAMNGIVMKLQTKLHLPRVLSIALTYVALVAMLVGAIVYLLPPLVSELYNLVKTLNFPWLQDRVDHLSFTVSEIGSLANQLGNSAGAVFSALMSTFSGIFAFFTIMVISFYLIIDRRTLHLRAGWFTRDSKTIDKMDMFFDSLEAQLGGWVRGQLILMIVIGLVTYIGLSLLSVPYALPLALLAGMLEILPNLGPTIASVPAIVLALVTVSPVMAGAVALFYIVVQQFENSFLVPKIMKDNVDVSPLISIVSILVGFQLGGVLAALIAVPAYITLRTIYGIWLRDLIRS